MKQTTCLTTFLGVFLSAVPLQAGVMSEPVPGQAILRIEDEVSIETINLDYGTTTLAIVDLGSRPFYLVGLPDGVEFADFEMQIENDDRIRDSDQNFEAGDPDPGTQSFFFGAAFGDFANQPLRQIIDLNHGPGDGINNGPMPAPIIVAVIDSGVDATHPWLAGKLLAGESLRPNEPSADDVGDGVDNDGDGLTDEMVGHGTFVAGLISYVAPEAQILPLRVLDSDGGTNVFLVAQAIERAIDLGASVINISLGTTEPSNVIEEAVLDANALGITVVASVGNEGTDALVRYPSATPSVIAVTSVDNNDVVAPFSNFGTHVDLAAPGVNVVSTVPGGYGMASGTSYSAPLVAGLAARLLQFSPGLSPDVVQSTIVSTSAAIDPVNPGMEGEIGAGRIVVGATLGVAGGSAPLLVNDLNLDLIVDIRDLNLVLGNFSRPSSAGDANGDGMIDILDLNRILGTLGSID